VAREHRLDWRGPILRSLAVLGAAMLLWHGLAMLPLAPWAADVMGAILAGSIAVAVLWRDLRHVLASSSLRLPGRRRSAEGVAEGVSDTAIIRVPGGDRSV
jgi:hypothetical protein